jgi:hypothetical protein
LYPKYLGIYLVTLLPPRYRRDDMRGLRLSESFGGGLCAGRKEDD